MKLNMPEPETKEAKVEPANTVQNEVPPVREISQTDHLNKKLLTSLFNRMNEADSVVSEKVESDERSDDEEWKD